MEAGASGRRVEMVEIECKWTPLLSAGSVCFTSNI